MILVLNVIFPLSKKYKPAIGITNSVIILITFNAISTKLADLTPRRLMMVTMPSKKSSWAAKT